MPKTPAWKKAEDEKLIQLAEAGYTNAEIAAVMPGRTLRAVKNRRVRLLTGKTGQRVNAPKADEIKRIRALADDGLTSRAIADEVGRTKGGIIRICQKHKIKLKHTPREGRRKAQGWTDARFMSDEEREKRRQAALKVEKQRQDEMQERIDAANEGALRLPLVTVELAPVVKWRSRAKDPHEPHHYNVRGLTVDQCRFAVTEAGPHEFCGKPVLRHSTWCPAHHSICHTGETVPLPKWLRKTMEE